MLVSDGPSHPSPSYTSSVASAASAGTPSTASLLNTAMNDGADETGILQTTALLLKLLLGSSARLPFVDRDLCYHHPPNMALHPVLHEPYLHHELHHFVRCSLSSDPVQSCANPSLD